MDLNFDLGAHDGRPHGLPHRCNQVPVLEEVTAQIPDGPARFPHAVPGHVARNLERLLGHARRLLKAVGSQIELQGDACQFLLQRVVQLSRNSVSFFEHRSALQLAAEDIDVLVQAASEHDCPKHQHEQGAGRNSQQFQGMTQAIKFSPKPVVIAPFGLALGGGCEVSLHAAARQPHAELYMGLVEVGVGLLPGGGGCKEMLLRAVDSAASIRPGGRGESVELMEAMKKGFETIATAKVSTSAHEARGLGFLSNSDRVTMNRERILSDAKARALQLVRAGYEPPVMRTDIPAPGENILAALKMGVHLMRQGNYISDHEQKLGTKIAEVLCGGNITPGTPVSEQYLLDLEREAFKSLCGEKKTQERIQFTLKTGKTLRN